MINRVRGVCQRRKDEGGLAELLNENTPGKDRTCDLLFRRQALYPLSYRRAGGILA
jgi:hypothetical protein